MKANQQCSKVFKTLRKNTSEEIHLQSGPCTSAPYNQFKIVCQACKRNQPCSFINLRGFKINNSNLVYGPYFPPSKKPDLNCKSLRFNTKPYSRYANTYALKKIRQTLQKSLQRQMEVVLHGSNKPIQRNHIPGFRHVCDTCSTSFFIHHYVCAYCAIEICMDCYETLGNTLYGYHNGRVFSEKKHSQSEFVLFSKLSERSICDLMGSTAMEADGYLYNEEYDSDDMSTVLFDDESRDKKKLPQPHTYDIQQVKKRPQSNSQAFTSKQPQRASTISKMTTDQSIITTVVQVSHPTFTNDTKQPLSHKQSVIIENEKRVETKHHIAIKNEKTIDELDPLKNYLKKLKSPKDGIEGTLQAEKRTEEEPFITPLNKPARKPRSSNTKAIQQSKPSSLDYLNLPASEMSLDLFQKYWQTQRPALVTHSTSKSEFEWTPQMFRKACGDDNLLATDFDNKVYEIPAKVYFEALSSRRRRQELCKKLGSSEVLKVKDWPQNQDLANKLPGLYEDFMRTVPAPEYCSATGYLNLANRLPEEYIPPDLGPKLFISYGSDLKGKTGKTNLHCDITDAVNVMYYADNKTVREQPVAASVWHVFPRESLKDLKRYIRRYKKDGEEVHPIFDHAFYLTAKDLHRLKERFGVVPFTICQNAGDAVFIPAGCAHQVTNYSNSIKCAFDFLSPENVQNSMFISEQLRKLSKPDVLQVQTTLAYAWLSLKADSA